MLPAGAEGPGTGNGGAPSVHFSRAGYVKRMEKRVQMIFRAAISRC